MCGYEAQLKENGALSDEAERNGQKPYIQDIIEGVIIQLLFSGFFGSSAVGSRMA